MIQDIIDKVVGKGSKGKKRSSKWRTVRKHFLKDNPTCAACGSSKKLEIHHLKPFHSHPELELVKSNLITLCENKKYGICCHQLVGHRGNYRKINENCERDAEYWHEQIHKPDDSTV
jgi:hypothetical protein